MTDYSKISAKMGHKHWISSITHDDGQFASDGGGKSTGSFGAPGKGKTTLACYVAQNSIYVSGSKNDFVNALAANEPTTDYKVFMETVIWRIRDFDSFANIIPQNWMKSFHGNSCATVKDLHLFVHEDDDVLFYSYNHKRQIISVKNLPPIERYKDTDDIMRKLHWGAINAVLEPQTYKLSHNLIQKLREKKMDITEDADRKLATKKRLKDKPRGVRKSTRTTPVEYEQREVSSAFFWFDMIDTAMKNNRYRHITLCIDEWDDIAEARSEGDTWKLIDVLAQDWKTLRKANISTHLTTHQTDYVDWRILKRIDYFVWMKGAQCHPAFSMINRQNVISDLPMGMFLIEQRNISFGKEEFGKIPYAQPTVRIDGLKGEELRLTNEEANMIISNTTEV